MIFIAIIESFVLYVIIFTIILNIINVLIIIGFTREISKALGTPLDVGALLRLI